MRSKPKTKIYKNITKIKGTMAKILRNGDCIIPLDKILAVHIPNPGDKVVDVILSNNARFSFHCKTSEEAKETLNIIQKKLEDSE